MSTHTHARIPFSELAPKAFKSLYALSNAVHEASLGHRLIELVLLRVSQVNGCGFCVDMHWQALTQLDVAPRLLNAVAVWRETPFFDARERAALHWAEIVTDISRRDSDRLNRPTAVDPSSIGLASTNSSSVLRITRAWRPSVS